MKLCKNSSSELLSILKGAGDSFIDAGGGIFLEDGSNGLIKSRSVAFDNSRIIARSRLIGGGAGRGHVDCRGIMMGDSASIEAIPVIESENRKAVLTHEARIGRIEEEQLFYLETRGFTEEEATELIIRGFLSPGIPWLEPGVRREMEKLVEIAAKGA